ncbi:MAG: hypothetical protein K8W52_18230 [Deltaproteobacteria bacterium]|nr:hypothetical protein [Deltaproteobacteria bacterium]
MRALAIVLVLAACRGRDEVPVAHPAPAAPRARFLKGQLHVHSDNSGDSTTPAAAVAHWYAQHGFDFLVYTDHNAITTYRSDELLTIPGVELTRNLGDCDPPPETDMGCLMHVNALFVAADRDQGVTLPALDTTTRLGFYDASLAVTRELGGIAQLNHPNMAWMMDAPMITALARRGAILMEVANQNEVESSAGDAQHPSTEALWDRALTAGVTIYGVATDDAHHYDDAAAVRAAGDPAYVGDLGWVMVRAAKDPAAIRAALGAGDFYASTGVALVDTRVADGALVIAVADTDTGPYTTTIIGTGGAVLARSRELETRFALARAPRGYVRAVVVDRRGHKAWTQPVRVP